MNHNSRYSVRASSLRRSAALALAVGLGMTVAGCGSDDDSASAPADAAAAPKAAALADAAMIRKRIIGNTVTGTMSPDSAYTEFYAPDGSIRGASYQASWSIDADQLCLNFDEAPQHDCYRVKIDGQSLEWHRQNEVQGTGTIVEGNPNNF